MSPGLLVVAAEPDEEVDSVVVTDPETVLLVKINQLFETFRRSNAAGSLLMTDLAIERVAKVVYERQCGWNLPPTGRP